MNQTSQDTTTLYTIPILTMNGTTTTLDAYQNQVLLIVNMASRCGFTPQYKELEALYQDYKAQGFSVLGFPCDQFMHQEPGSNKEIKALAESCYKITFPLFAKIDVKGSNQAPLYTYLTQHIQKKPWKLIPWNFTKFLVDAEGNVLKRYLPITSFKKIREELERLF
ncbi:glutathione peroxidase [Legionella fairfieldensis]|uniref:glutathione peroxidase n=1 Tax=Legionella fairfieldensis TaxID=45064 RepID=UPI000685A3AF|nr:glutathione peroxidase [Legionella fairfieldensis]